MTEQIPTQPTREQLAEYAHEAWSGWMMYQFSKGYFRYIELEGSVQVVWIMPPEMRQRWERQMRTPYADLPESEKASDREEADRMLAIVHGICFCGCDPCKYCDKLLEPSQ